MDPVRKAYALSHLEKTLFSLQSNRSPDIQTLIETLQACLKQLEDISTSEPLHLQGSLEHAYHTLKNHRPN